MSVMAPPLHLFDQSGAGLQDDFRSEAELMAKPRDRGAPEGGGGRQHEHHVGSGHGDGGFDGGLHGDDGTGIQGPELVGRHDAGRIAGQDQSLGSEAEQKIGDLHGAGLDEARVPVTVGRVAAVRDVNEGLSRKLGAEGLEHGHAADAGIIDADGRGVGGMHGHGDRRIHGWGDAVIQYEASNRDRLAELLDHGG